MTDQAKKSSSGLIGLLVAGALLFLIVRLSPFGGPSWPKVGDRAPNINSFPVEGTLSSASNQVVLLDFWASWCGPCELSMPMIDEVYKNYTNRGLVVIGVSVD